MTPSLAIGNNNMILSAQGHHLSYTRLLIIIQHVSSLGLFQINDEKVNKIQQTNILLDKWIFADWSSHKTYFAHWPNLPKLKFSEKSRCGKLTRQGLYILTVFNNISFTSKLCNIVKKLSFLVEV